MPEDEKSQETFVDPASEPSENAEPAQATETPAEPAAASGNAIAEELLYLRAEFENYKKRMEREQDRAIRFSNEKIIGELLFVIDLFERALAHGASLKDGNQEVKTFAEGVEMTHRELLQILSRFGVEMIGNEGETFNPAWHEAITQQATSEAKANTVLSVVQKGCRLHGRLLKPAKVIVGKADPNFEEKE
ncbi:MAG: nucleotide exchange factor GrpE [Bdellovibrionota bacterium]